MLIDSEEAWAPELCSKICWRLSRVPQGEHMGPLAFISKPEPALRNDARLEKKFMGFKRAGARAFQRMKKQIQSAIFLHGAEISRHTRTLYTHNHNMETRAGGIHWKLFALYCLLANVFAQDFGPTQFICTSVPKDVDICTATLQNSVPGEELRATVMQLRETVLQQKETIVNQKETIRELTAKLVRCESQSAPEAGAGGRRKESGSKNTMGDVSRGPSETLAQLSQTLQNLKQRLENLEV